MGGVWYPESEKVRKKLNQLLGAPYRVCQPEKATSWRVKSHSSLLLQISDKKRAGTGREGSRGREARGACVNR